MPGLPHNDVGALYRSHHPWLLGWLRRRMANPFCAADLAQDTFVRLLGKPALGALREPRAFLATVAGGLLANHWRRQALEKAYQDLLASQPEATAPSPEHRAELLQTLAEVATVLDTLPAQTREIFLQSQLDGLTYPQIAARLGISVNAVQKAMLRAVDRCSEVLE